MLRKASRFLTSNLENGFFAWGLTVARHPFPVIIIGMTINIHHCHHHHQLPPPPRHHHNPQQQHDKHHNVLPRGHSWLPHPICHLQSWFAQPQDGTPGAEKIKLTLGLPKKNTFLSVGIQASSFEKKSDNDKNTNNDNDDNRLTCSGSLPTQITTCTKLG